MSAIAQPLPDEAAEPACNTCGHAPCLLPGFCRACRVADAKAARERRNAGKPRPALTPQVTVEAIMHCMRTRGISTLQESANVERLARCDAAALAEIDRRIKKLTGDDHGQP
jgi:hypothetical protein